MAYDDESRREHEREEFKRRTEKGYQQKGYKDSPFDRYEASICAVVEDAYGRIAEADALNLDVQLTQQFGLQKFRVFELPIEDALLELRISQLVNLFKRG